MMKGKSTSIGHKKKKMMIRIITTPYRALCKAKDFYIRSITDCANHQSSFAIGMPPNNSGGGRLPMPRSFSTSSYGSTDSAAEDLRELIRANSSSSSDRLADVNNITREELELYIQQHLLMAKSQKVPRSVSVGMGMGRIDEGEEDKDVSLGKHSRINRINAKSHDHLMFPRSKSHAVTTTTNINLHLNAFS